MRKLICLFLILGATSVKSQNGTLIFNPEVIHEIYINSSYPALFDTLEAHYDFDGNVATASYIMCDVSVDGTSYDSVGVKEKGFYSNWGMNPGDKKKPFKISLDEYVNGQRYDGIKTINLNNGFKDPTLMHDPLCYRVLRESGVPAPRTSFAKVYLNNVFWGLYVIAEEPDKNFLEMNYPDKNGNMYKCEESYLEWEGPSKASYIDNFEQKLKNSGDTSWADLIYFTDIINNTGANFKDSLLRWFNPDYFSKTIGIDYLTDSWDNYILHGRNYFMYHSTTTDKFNWIPWDYNLSFSSYDIDILWDDAMTNFNSGYDPPLVAGFFGDATLTDLYLQNLCGINENIYTNPHLDPFIDSMKNLIRPVLVIDPNKFFTMNNFDQNIDNDIVAQFDMYKGLKSTITDKHNATATYMSANSVSCANVGLTEHYGPPDDIFIFPNPTQSEITIDLTGFYQEKEYTIFLYDGSGRKILEKGGNTKREHLNLSEFPTGLYFVVIENENKRVARKLMISR